MNFNRTIDSSRCAAGPPDADVGCSWGVKPRQQVSSWREPHLQGNLVWGPSFSICYVYSLHAVSLMPPEPGFAVLHISVVGPKLWPATGIRNSWDFSPCSQVLVASWPAKHSFIWTILPPWCCTTGMVGSTCASHAISQLRLSVTARAPSKEDFFAQSPKRCCTPPTRARGQQ